jgi:hypothetical protein
VADLTVQTISLPGLSPAFAAAAVGGDAFPNSGREYLHVKNGGGSEVTVTVDSQAACNQGYDHNAVVAVPASEERLIGPFPKARFNDANDKVQVAYSDVTSVTVAAVRLP